METIQTYLGLCRKYPEAREDLLELRRQKNFVAGLIMIGSFLIGFFAGRIF
jgi:hypothetical protein